MPARVKRQPDIMGEKNFNNSGRFFEDFTLEQTMAHSVPRTITQGDVALNIALTGQRFPLSCASVVAQELGYKDTPIDDMLVFNMVFGKTVADISLNAIANLGYSACLFKRPVMVGDTLTATSKVIGLKENSNGKSGIVYVHSQGFNHKGHEVLTFIRWVMVRKRDTSKKAQNAMKVPKLQEALEPHQLTAPENTDYTSYKTPWSGCARLWDSYQKGETINHTDGTTIEEAEHMLATRQTQNSARVHFNQLDQNKTPTKRRIVYGGYIISLARALSFNGLGNAAVIAAINGGRHIAPCFGGDTIFAWSRVLDKAPLKDRHDLGALRVQTVVTKNKSCATFPPHDETGKDAMILDLDFWALMPRALP